MHAFLNSALLVQSNFVVRLQLQSSGNTNLPPRAINVKGGTVQSITPVDRSNGRLFDVAIARAQNARFITVSTAAGLSLASGLALAQSNSITVEVDTDAPQVTLMTLLCMPACTLCSHAAVLKPAALADMG